MEKKALYSDVVRGKCRDCGNRIHVGCSGDGQVFQRHLCRPCYNANRRRAYATVKTKTPVPKMYRHRRRRKKVSDNVDRCACGSPCMSYKPRSNYERNRPACKRCINKARRKKYKEKKAAAKGTKITRSVVLAFFFL